MPFSWTYFKDIPCTQLTSPAKPKKLIIVELSMVEISDEPFEEGPNIIDINNLNQFELSPIEPKENGEVRVETFSQTEHPQFSEMLMRSTPINSIAEETFVISNSNSGLAYYLILAFSIGIGVDLSFKLYSSQIAKWFKNRFKKYEIHIDNFVSIYISYFLF